MKIPPFQIHWYFHPSIYRFSLFVSLFLLTAPTSPYSTHPLSSSLHISPPVSSPSNWALSFLTLPPSPACPPSSPPPALKTSACLQAYLYNKMGSLVITLVNSSTIHFFLHPPLAMALFCVLKYSITSLILQVE